MKSKVFPYLSRLPEKFNSILFCFHHAGGSASVYFPFVQNDEGIAIVPIELSGHGARRVEEQQVEWKKIVDEISQEIVNFQKEYNKPVRLLGCSLGSLLAFECAAELEKKNFKIQQLIICSHSSPDEVPPGYKTYMGKDALIDELNTLSGTDSQIMNDEEMLDFFLPVIYNDYLLHDNYCYDGKVLNNIPVMVIAGKSDPYFNHANMNNWRNMTTGKYVYKETDGGHFFTYEKSNFQQIIADIKEDKSGS